MARRCATAWCNGPAEPGRGLCTWCYEHRGCHADGSPRDPRHPWYQGPPKERARQRRWFPRLVHEQDAEEHL